jgi:L-seryl-tRNA(Ser) seleniumtransferase
VAASRLCDLCVLSSEIFDTRSRIMTAPTNTDGVEGLTRRELLKAGAGSLAILSATEGRAAAWQRAAASPYDALGMKRIINAAGTITVLGGSIMPPEVTAAWLEASRRFVDVPELQEKVGQRIAELVGVEAALVTTGAAGSMMLGTAAALTLGRPDLIGRLPDLTGVPNEVVKLKAHRSCYDRQVAACGARLVEVETRADLDRAISGRTALMLFYNFMDPDGPIKRQEWIDVARARRIPTLLDAAADVPPVEELSRCNKMGFDLVAFSGGKALRGPQDSLLLGRKDLVDAARMNSSPRCGTIGRMLKVGKENMMALLAAVERYVRIDHAAEWREWERRLGVIESAVRAIPGVTTERMVPPIANRVPHVVLLWDEARLKVTREQVTKTLAAGDPSIRLGRVAGTGDRGLLVSVFQLEPGEIEIVATRLREALEGA